MSVNSAFGSFPVTSRRWTIKVEVSQENVGYVPAEEFKVDQYLPTLAVDPFDPAAAVVIMPGRFCSVGFTGGRGGSDYRFAYNDTGKTPITLHDGKNLIPAGMSINQIFKEASDFMTNSNAAKFKRGFTAEVPFVLSINNAHGTCRAGDKVTGYWGSTTSTSTISYKDRGKPVKWYAKKLYTQTLTASASFDLDSAIYPGIEPRMVAAFSASGGTFVSVATPTMTFTGTKWRVTLGAAASEVWYEYGQDADQIGGEIIRIQSLTDMLNRDDFLRWVEYDNLPFPPATPRYPVTAVSNETPSTVVAGSQYRVASYPVSVHHPFTVDVKATITDKDGTTTVHTDWYTLPTSAILSTRGYFTGLYHNVNWRTGVIELASNITSLTAIRVTYSYLTDNRDGAPLWGGGVENLTDGRYTNQGLANSGAGVPAHLNVADVVAAMRLHVA